MWGEFGNYWLTWEIYGRGWKKYGEGTWTCGGKNENLHDGKEGTDEYEHDSVWGEDVINGTDGLLVGGDGSTKFNDCSSNSFVNGIFLFTEQNHFLYFFINNDRQLHAS